MNKKYVCLFQFFCRSVRKQLGLFSIFLLLDRRSALPRFYSQTFGNWLSAEASQLIERRYQSDSYCSEAEGDRGGSRASNRWEPYSSKGAWNVGGGDIGGGVVPVQGQGLREKLLGEPAGRLPLLRGLGLQLMKQCGIRRFLRAGGEGGASPENLEFDLAK